MTLALNLLSVLLFVLVVLALTLWARRDRLSPGRDLTADRVAAHRPVHR